LFVDRYSSIAIRRSLFADRPSLTHRLAHHGDTSRGRLRDLPARESARAMLSLSIPRDFLRLGRRRFGRNMLSRLHGALQSGYQSRSSCLQLCTVMQGQFAEHPFTLPGKREQYFSPVASAPVTTHKTTGRQPVCQLDGAVVPNLQALGQLSDTRADLERQALEGQHELVLPRLQPDNARRLFAKVQELADMVTQFG
jgi:hypothetical protein